MPAAYDRKTGCLIYRRWLTGGTCVRVLEDKGTFLGTTRNGNQQAYSLDTGVEIPGPSNGKSYPPYWRDRHTIRTPAETIDAPDKVYALASTPRCLLAGGENFVAAYDTTDKKWIWTEKQILGQVRGLAVSGNRIPPSVCFAVSWNRTNTNSLHATNIPKLLICESFR